MKLFVSCACGTKIELEGSALELRELVLLPDAKMYSKKMRIAQKLQLPKKERKKNNG